MAHALLDTNVIIDHLENRLVNFDFGNRTYAISTLTIFELLTYPGMGLAEEMDLRLIVNNCEHIPVTFKIAERAASLGRTRRRKSLDLFIAASAIEFNLTLFTNNIRDFKNIPGLKVKKI